MLCPGSKGEVDHSTVEIGSLKGIKLELLGEARDKVRIIG
jgi:hypothetical protein